MLTDCHAHLYLKEFDHDFSQVLDRAAHAGIDRMVNAAIDIASSRKVIDMATAFPPLYAAIGIHPNSLDALPAGYMDRLEQMAAEPEVVAIGEIGLDYYLGAEHKEAQMALFKNQLDLAGSMGLPVILHCRDAEDDMQALLADWISRTPPCRGKWRGIRHCFNADLPTAGFYIDAGFMLSFGGYIGYPSSTGLRRTVEQIPIEAILLETDCPYLPPQEFRRKRNEPAYLAFTARVMAEVKGMAYRDTARITTANAGILFNFEPA
ncbi:MAG: TatD family hydrolase [Dehalococcoidaceae bacterium]|nr:TatD family hydrolase [Dehalococcoidaceae bacterium]